MTGLTILFSRYFSHKRILLVVSVFFLLMMTAVMLFHSDPENIEDEYLMCKVCALIPMMTAVFLPMSFMVHDTTGNRFMRSVPCANSLYTRGIPVFSSLMPFGWSVLSNAIYAAFILITGQDICNISDMMILTGIVGGVLALINCIVLSVRMGGLFFLLIYFPFLIIIMTGTTCESDGFGLPLWASGLIFFGSFLAAFSVGLIISGVAYKRIGFKEITQTQANV